jgi:ABC-2 type transport system permease protein
MMRCLLRPYALLLRQYYLLRGNVMRFIPLFVWVAIEIVLWGFISRYLGSVASGFNFISTLLGAVLLWGFFIRVKQGVTIAFFEDIWSRNFLNLFASPLSIGEYLAGLVLSSITTSMIGLLAMVLIATGVFGLSFFAYGLAFIPFLLILFSFGIAMGILGSAVLLRFGPSSEWLVWSIPALISPFAAVFYPVSVLPGWMRLVAESLPPVYVFEGVRGIVNGGGIDGASLVTGLALALAYVFFACRVFIRIYRRAVRVGAIARYAAEIA